MRKYKTIWEAQAVRKEAFIYYCSLGKDRTLKAVAEKFGCTEGTVRTWRREGNWDQQILDTIEKDPVRQKAKYRYLIAQLMHKAIGDVEAGNIKVNTVNDLEKLARLDMLLMENDVNIMGE